VKRFAIILLCCLTLMSVGLSAGPSAALKSKKTTPAKAGAALANFTNPYSGVVLPTPPSEHPRLFFRGKDITLLKQKLSHPEMKPVWQLVITLSKLNHLSNGSYNAALETSIRANALIFTLEGNTDAGEKAVSRMTKYLAEVAASDTRNSGNTILTAAMFYDWCYPLLSEKQKAAYIFNVERLAKTMEIGYPPLRQGALTGHGTEWQLQRDLLSAAVAVYDEYPEMYQLVAGRFFKEMVPGRNIFYPSLAHHQGDNYGQTRFQQELWSALIFERLGSENPFRLKQQKEIPFQWIYMRRPDGQLVRDGDTMMDTQKTGEYWTREHYALMYLMASGYFKNPYFKAEFHKQGELAKFPIEAVLFYDPFVDEKEPADLPLTRFFPEPRAAMVARTGWPEKKVDFNSPVVIAEMKVKTIQFNNHQALDAGTFSLYYKGGLATKSGSYRGKSGGYFSNHDLNFNKRTIAQNGLLIFDPNEKSWGEITGKGFLPVNDGGQRWPNNREEAATVEELLNNGYGVGNVLGMMFGPDSLAPCFSYLKGDITKAYSGKVKLCRRSFVFLNLKDESHPAALIVFDKITASDPGFKKYWLLQSAEEPKVEGNLFTIARTKSGYNGKLVNQVLLPVSENMELEKIGGAGKEHWVFGQNIPNKPADPENSTESNGWRLQLSPKTPAETDYFLNVMQVMDFKGGPKMIKIEKLESEKMIGVKISDRVIFFSKNSERLKETISIGASASNDSLQFLITDLAEGSWNVQKQGLNDSFQIQSTKQGGAIYFKGTPGKYLLSYSENKPEVKLWGRFEVPFKNEISCKNSFADVELNAIFTRPGGSQTETWGFYDGNNTWKLRFMPDRPGAWKYTAWFSDNPLQKFSGTFQCVPSDIPGLISADETNPAWFGFKGGKHIFLRSFHAGDRFFASNWPAEKRTVFLDWLSENKYNMLSVASHYLNRDQEDRGLGWETPRLWDTEKQQPDPAEFAKMENLLDTLAARKIIIFPFAGFFGQKSNYPSDSAGQLLYLKYTIARLGASWNILYNVSGPEPLLKILTEFTKEQIDRWGGTIDSLNVGRHLLTVHNPTDENPFIHAPWASFQCLQGPKTVLTDSLYQGILRLRHPAQPLYAQETLWYGNLYHHKKIGHEYSDGDLRRNAFTIAMTAASLNFADNTGNSSTGFSGTLDLNERHQDKHDILKKVWDFFESVPFYEMSPFPAIADNGYCLAKPGSAYLVYLPEGGKVNVKTTGGFYSGEWIKASDTKIRINTGATMGNDLKAPSEDDWLLYLKKNDQLKK